MQQRFAAQPHTTFIDPLTRDWLRRVSRSTTKTSAQAAAPQRQVIVLLVHVFDYADGDGCNTARRKVEPEEEAPQSLSTLAPRPVPRLS